MPDRLGYVIALHVGECMIILIGILMDIYSIGIIDF